MEKTKKVRLLLSSDENFDGDIELIDNEIILTRKNSLFIFDNYERDLIKLSNKINELEFTEDDIQDLPWKKLLNSENHWRNSGEADISHKNWVTAFGNREIKVSNLLYTKNISTYCIEDNSPLTLEGMILKFSGCDKYYLLKGKKVYPMEQVLEGPYFQLILHRGKIVFRSYYNFRVDYSRTFTSKF